MLYRKLLKLVGQNTVTAMHQNKKMCTNKV